MPALYPYFKSFLLSVFLFCSLTTTLKANVKIPEHTRETCQQLIDEAQKDVKDNNYADALEKLLEAELIAEQNQWNDKLWDIKNRIGSIYYHTSGFGEALSYYRQALEITEKDKELNEKAHYPLNSIAVLYGREGKYLNSLEYYKKAYEILKNKKGSPRKMVACNMSDAYIKIGEVEKGLELLNDVKDDEGSPVVNFLWKSIYIEALIANGQIAEAQKLAEPVYAELTSDSKEGTLAHCFVCIAGLLSEVYEKQDEIDKAIVPAKEALFHTEKLSDHVDLYEIISRLYLQKGEYKTALLYKDSAFVAKDSLTASINRSQYEISKVRLKVSEYQNEISKKKEQQKLQQMLFIIVVVFILVISFFIYRSLKSKVTKQKQQTVIAKLALEKEKKERLLAEQELEIKKHETAERNRELSAKALYISNRNELIWDIISKLENNKRTRQNDEVVQLIKTIKSFLKTDNHLEDFIKHFEGVNPVFLKRLKEKYPELTANDIRFLCYVYMNLSLKEISIIFNITYDACRKRIKRIMNRMNLEEETSLYDYLIRL